MQVAGKGSVLPPSSNNVDLGDLPLTAKIETVSFNEGDDCEFYTVEFPDEYSKNFQTFLPTKPEDLAHQIVNLFYYRYGKNVALSSELPSAYKAGDTLTFTEEAA